MHSLYRAWLMRDAVTTASLTSPPDLIITVGNLGSELNDEIGHYGYQFVAHKYLVSMHSGYLKSLIQNESQNSGISTMNISLPNLTPESFGPLLTFMYTGYLDLTNENIYSVLLATHLLHMPRALELCRAYLVQNQSEIRRNVEYHQNLFHPHNSNFKIIKPIPSRKVLNFPQSIWSPLTNMSPLLIPTRPEGPFQSILPTKKLNVTPDAVKVPEIKSPLAIPSTSKNKNLSAMSSPTSSNESFTCDNRTVLIVKTPQEKGGKQKDDSVKNNKKSNNENFKVEYDVACCDGPVRFHRVLNENYGMSLKELKESPRNSEKNKTFEKISDKEYLENYPKTQFLKSKSSTNFSNFMHQQVIKSNLFKKPKITKGVIQMKRIVEKEICTQNFNKNEDNKTDDKKEENNSEVYTCIYCKHTFKSQYCYQKHAKRHLNSIEKDEKIDKSLVVFPPILSISKNEKKKEDINIKREVRLLDMNVQYYPCKTCGSKFPSYYFVHKHRKLCHSNEKAFDENSNNPSEYLNSSSSECAPQSSIP